MGVANALESLGLHSRGAHLENFTGQAANPGAEAPRRKKPRRPVLHMTGQSCEESRGMKDLPGVKRIATPYFPKDCPKQVTISWEEYQELKRLRGEGMRHGVRGREEGSRGKDGDKNEAAKTIEMRKAGDTAGGGKHGDREGGRGGRDGGRGGLCGGRGAQGGGAWRPWRR